MLPLSWTNRQTYGPEIRHVGQVEGYLGQVQRSGSRLKRQGHQVKKKNVLRVFQATRKASIRDVAARSSQEDPGTRSDRASTTTRNQEVIIIHVHATPYMNGRATAWGVFKAYAFFKNEICFNFSLSCQCRSGGYQSISYPCFLGLQIVVN